MKLFNRYISCIPRNEAVDVRLGYFPTNIKFKTIQTILVFKGIFDYISVPLYTYTYIHLFLNLWIFTNDKLIKLSDGIELI